MRKKIKTIYLDHASATRVDERVLKTMLKILKENFENAGAIHEGGVMVKKLLENERVNVSKIIGGHSDEIIFTSGATESNNLAILGVHASQMNNFLGPRVAHTVDSKKGGLNQTLKNHFFVPHVVTTNIEHASVLEVCKFLEKNKLAEMTYVNVDENGIVNPKKIQKALKKNTVLVSIMYANNEIGTIQPIKEIAKEIRHFRKNQNSIYPLFHTDATQAVNYLPINVERLGVDLMTWNSAKIYGPKGVGALYVKRKTPITKIMHGGNQEFDLRSGTENLPAVVGLAEALKITKELKDKENKRLTILRDYFISKLEHSHILKNVGMIINGDLKNRLPNNVNITILKIPSDLLVIELSAHGIYASEKSACKSGDKSASHVISALRNNNLESLRFSLGRSTTKKDVDYTINVLQKIIDKLKLWYN